MENLLQYYYPGLNVSFLSDEDFIHKMACLLKIREMEQADKVTEVLKKVING